MSPAVPQEPGNAPELAERLDRPPRHRRPHVRRLPPELLEEQRPVGTGEELHDALALLPPKQRDAVTFHYFGGLRYAEVADLLGNSESAARRAAADGMKRLRAMYREDRK